ncbi:MAG: hypothetical protein ACI9OD_002046 [Limisphaerales bacterium]|jgi:hypothetical protein
MKDELAGFIAVGVPDRGGNNRFSFGRKAMVPSEFSAIGKGSNEQQMFGGRCFLHNGNMMCGCDLKYGFSVRIGQEAYENTLKLKHVHQMDLTGVPLKGLVFVDREGFRTKAALTKWIERGLACTQSLPVKVKKKSKKR